MFAVNRMIHAVYNTLNSQAQMRLRLYGCYTFNQATNSFSISGHFQGLIQFPLKPKLSIEKTAFCPLVFKFVLHHVLLLKMSISLLTILRGTNEFSIDFDSVWWRMLETIYVDDSFEKLVTDLRCWWQRKSHNHNDFSNSRPLLYS